MKTTVDANELINQFVDMAKRETLLVGDMVTQEDLLMQIIGTIAKTTMESKID